MSPIRRNLDQVVEIFQGGLLGAGPYSYVWLDVLARKVRQGARPPLVDEGRRLSGHRRERHRSAGVSVLAERQGSQRVATGHLRCPSGIETGHLLGVQRSRLAAPRHQFHRRSAEGVPKRPHPGVVAKGRIIYQQFSPRGAHALADRMVALLRERFHRHAQVLGDATTDIQAFTAFPAPH